MQSYLKIGLFALVISFCIYQGYGYFFGYNKYIPAYFNDNIGLFQSRDSVTEWHKKNIQKVFANYQVKYKVEDGQVFYRGYIDKELLWNCTTKANDTQLLNSR